VALDQARAVAARGLVLEEAAVALVAAAAVAGLAAAELARARAAARRRRRRRAEPVARHTDRITASLHRNVLRTAQAK
jgi:hypothetical protein